MLSLISPKPYIRSKTKWKQLVEIRYHQNISTERKMAQLLADKICAEPKSAKPIPDLNFLSIRAAISNDVSFLETLYSDAQNNKLKISDVLDNVDRTGNTPLIWAADAGNTKVVEFLAGIKEVEILRQGFLGNTALARSVRNGHFDVVKALLKEANLRTNSDLGASNYGNIHNHELQYPIHFASFYEHPSILELMLDLRFDTYVKDRKGRSPLEDTKSDLIKDMIAKKRSMLI